MKKRFRFLAIIQVIAILMITFNMGITYTNAGEDSEKLVITAATADPAEGFMGLGVSNLWDGDVNTAWIPNTVIDNEVIRTTATVTLQSTSIVKKARLYSKDDCFPREFTLQGSFDGINFSDIAGASYSVNQNAANGWVELVFTKPVVAKYVRIATVRGGRTWDNAGWLVKVTELELYGTVMTVPPMEKLNIASTEAVPAEGLWGDNTKKSPAICDGDINTSWIPNTEIGSEFISTSVSMKLSGISKIGKVRLYCKDDCFPREFSVQASTDGSIFQEVPGGYFSAKSNVASGWVEILFTRPVYATDVRIATTRGGATWDSAGYMVRIAECEIYGETVTLPAMETLEISGVTANPAEGLFGNTALTPDKLIDGDLGTPWIPNTDTSKEEIAVTATVSLKTVSTVGRVRLYASADCFSREFKLQSSKTGQLYTDIPGGMYDVNSNTPMGWVDFIFDSQVEAKYIRIVTVRGDFSGSWLVKFNEIEILGTPLYTQELAKLEVTGVTANPEAPLWGDANWSSDHLIDGNPATGWCPNRDHLVETNVSSASLELKTLSTVNRVRMYAMAECFPREFKIQSSETGAFYTDVPGAAFSVDTDTTEGWIDITFNDGVLAQYIRIVTARSGKTGDGTAWFVHIGEVELFGTAGDAAGEKLTILKANANKGPFNDASNEVTSLYDGNLSTCWIPSTDFSIQDAQGAWARITLDCVSTVYKAKLLAGVNLFPREFKLQYSVDGYNFTDIPGGSFTAASEPSQGWVHFNFSTPVQARYIRIALIKMGPTDDGNFLSKIHEIELYGIKGENRNTTNGTRPDTDKKLEVIGSTTNTNPFLGDDLNSATSLWDDDTSTSWIPATPFVESTDAWARMRLGSTATITDIRVYATATVFPREFKLQSSVDGVTFTDIPGGLFWADDDIEEGWYNINLATPVQAKYIRLQLVRNCPTYDGNYLSKVAEVELFGTAGTDVDTTSGTRPDPDLLLRLNGAISNVDPFLGSDENGVNNLWDDDTSTSWIPSTDIHLETSNAWARITLGAKSQVSDVSLYATASVFPREFKLQSSIDGENFTDIPGGSYLLNADADEGWFNFNFATPVEAKYIRIFLIRNGPTNDGNWLSKIAEVQVYGVAGEDKNTLNGTKPNLDTKLAVSAVTSNKGAFVVEDNAVTSLCDDDTSTTWIPNADIHSESTDSYALIQLERYSKITDFRLYATVTVFPREFKLQVSQDGVTFTDIPGGLYWADGDAPEGWFNFNFTAPVEGKYIRIQIIRNGPTSDGNWLTKIAEAEVFGQVTVEKPTEGSEIQVKETASSSNLENSDFTVDKIADGDLNSFWCAQWGNAEKADLDEAEWASIGFENKTSVGKVTLYPSIHVNGNINHFPADFKLQYSVDGNNWKNIPGQSYTGYTAHEGANDFVFANSVNAKYIRLYVTKKGLDGDPASTVFLVKVAEMKAFYGNGSFSDSPDTGDTGIPLQSMILLSLLTCGLIVFLSKKRQHI